MVIKLDLHSCLEVRSVASALVMEDGEEVVNWERVYAPFDLLYDDSIERIGADSREEMLDWFVAIQYVLTLAHYPGI